MASNKSSESLAIATAISFHQKVDRLFQFRYLLLNCLYTLPLLVDQLRQNQHGQRLNRQSSLQHRICFQIFITANFFTTSSKAEPAFTPTILPSISSMPLTPAVPFSLPLLLHPSHKILRNQLTFSFFRCICS